MEKHHPIWKSTIGSIQFLGHVIKAAKAHDEEDLLLAVYNASKNWNDIEDTIELISDYFHSHKQPFNIHPNDYFTGIWIASDIKKADYINQNGNLIIYSALSSDGITYNVYIGHLVTDMQFVVVGNNNKGEKRTLVGKLNNLHSEITVHSYTVDVYNDSIKKGVYYLDK